MIPKKNVVVFFYMNGCPYCDSTRPYWNKLKKINNGYKFIEIESSDVDDKMRSEMQIDGYPHFVKINQQGKKTHVSGSKSSYKELYDSIFSTGDKLFGRARRSGTRRLIRRVRKTARRS